MNSSAFRRSTLRICVAAMLAGCGGSQLPTGAPSVALQDSAPRAEKGFQLLYRFTGGRQDGANPLSGLTDLDGTLYGTTSEAGRSGCGYNSGCGTVYSISTTGAEKLVHRFAAGSDGWLPFAGLTKANGTLYGTTRYGGGSGCVEGFGCGTVYTISATGAEQVLFDFGDYGNGSQPFAGLVNVKGKFYGTTWNGGAYDNGTVYRLTKAGVETVLHSFTGASDGALPYAGLVDVNDTLYGTTWGGGSGCGASAGCGTVFSMSTSGAETVLHSFAGGSDGANPNAGLVAVKGALYGTTSSFLGCGSSGGSCGTVYRITTTGSEKVLHRFGRGSDGAQPLAGLIDERGTLYGTTQAGGSAPGCSIPAGCGTVYSLSTSGTEKVLHRFNGADGAYPQAKLIYVRGRLYGTTVLGGTGCHRYGCGTVFALSP